MISVYRTELRRLRRRGNSTTWRGVGRTHRVTGRPAAIAALVVCIIVILVAKPAAQQTTAFAPAMTSGSGAAADTPTDIDLLVGRSTVLNVGSAIARVSLTVPDIADAMVTAPSQLLIHGKQPGTISLFVWDRSGAIKTFEVKVRRDLTALTNHMKQLFPGEMIEVRGSGKDVVISGTVSSKYVAEKAADVAAGYVEKKENVVNLLRQQEGVASNQVMLKVRFAEVSRSALQELGASLFSDGNNNFNGRTTTQQFSAPFFDQQGPIQGKNLVFSDYLNLFLFDTKNQIGAVVKALQSKGLFQSLAEPNLIAINGKEASFLAGGEFPYPVVQGAGGNNTSVTIMFKEFGIRLNFTPTVIGNDLINLKVRPEVSSLDFANGVIVSGFRVPALTTRRTETEVELQNGQTFAIAGLMNNTLNDTMSKVPGIGDIPILGLLFRSKAHQKNQTELVVMITPTIVRRGSTGVSEGLPSLVAPYMGAPSKRYPQPEPWIGSPRYPTNQGTPRGGTAPTPDASSAAAKPAQPPAARSAQPERVVAQPAVPSRPVQTAPQATPLASRPIQGAPAVHSAPAAASKPAAVTAPSTTDSKPLHISEEQRKAMMALEKREEQRRIAEARGAEQRRIQADRKRAEQAAIDARLRADQNKKDEEAKKLADRLEKERAKREAEVSKKNAEIARKKAEEDAKRERTLAEAADRLKQAQAAYQAELEKAKGASHEKSKGQKH
jgi:pilus assembly protein CpaC